MCAQLLCLHDHEDKLMDNLTGVKDFFLLGFQSSHNSAIFLFCLLLVVFCATLCGNFLIITLVSTSKNLQTPMYFFISHLSISDLLLSIDILPNMLHIILKNGGPITLTHCMIQLYFFSVSEVFDCLLLAVMSYDRYVAIWNPLRYTSIMTRDRCEILSSICWAMGCSVALMYAVTISMLTFCGPNIFDHFYCDFVPLLENSCSSTYSIELEIFVMCFFVLFMPLAVIIVSYAKIIVTILRFQSNVSRQKAFSTCSAHLTVVSIFYCTLLSVYFFPKVDQTVNVSKILSLLYTVFTPLVNPIIYSLRNKDIKKSLSKIINKIVIYNKNKLKC
ncbi:olfactory receptor 10A7-like [Anomaloglossus baeobatrachus]